VRWLSDHVDFLDRRVSFHLIRDRHRYPRAHVSIIDPTCTTVIRLIEDLLPLCAADPSLFLGSLYRELFLA
jgi:hypothetical protein